MSVESSTNNEETAIEIWGNLSYDDQEKVREHIIREKIKNMSAVEKVEAKHEASVGLADEWRGDGEDLFRYLNVYIEEIIRKMTTEKFKESCKEAGLENL